MKKYATLFENGDHKWHVFFYDDYKQNNIVATNEYLIQHGGRYLLTDPGGTEIFPEFVTALSEVADINEINQFFCSHQDPDIFSAITLWLKMKPELKVYLSEIWVGFMLHFGGTVDTFDLIPDEGSTISLGGLALQAIPAHYLHSSGNFNLYDKNAKILFSGDIGASMVSQEGSFIVKDFDAHIPEIQGFHQRWMGSNEHKNQWCERISKLDIDFLCPQHGLIYEGEDVKRFIDWFYDLKVGLLKG